MDFYDILGVPKNAGTEEIKNAYRILAAKYNPDNLFIDKNVSYHDGIQKIVLINEAYHILIDPVKRKLIDKNPKIAQKEVSSVEKKYQSIFETTIRYKIEKLKNEKIKSVRERAEETFSEKKALLRDTLENSKTESVRDRLARKQAETLHADKKAKEEFPQPDTEIHVQEILSQEDVLFTEERILPQFEYTISDTAADNADKIIDDKKSKEAGENSAGLFDKQELFYRAIKLMDKKKYSEAMALFTALIPLAESYPYVYVIKACQCGFFQNKFAFIHQNTLDAMYAYVSSKWLTFLLDAPDNQLFRVLIELFFQNFALCSLNKKIDLKELIKAENEVFHIVKQLAKTNPKVMGFASLYSAIAYADLALLYKEKSFLMKALDKLNYVPEELYDRKKKQRFNRMLKHFFKRKEIKQFRLIYPFLRSKNT